MNDEPVKLIQTFFNSFAVRNFNEMSRLTTEDFLFFDPVFELLQSESVVMMWRVRYETSQEFKLTYSDIIDLGDGYYTVGYKINYLKNDSDRKINFVSKAHIKLEGNKIAEWSDAFSLHQLCIQEFGFMAWLFGWNRYYQSQYKKKAKRGFIEFINSQNRINPL